MSICLKTGSSKDFNARSTFLQSRNTTETKTVGGVSETKSPTFLGQMEEWMDRQADSSIPQNTFILQGHKKSFQQLVVNTGKYLPNKGKVCENNVRSKA